MAFFTIYSANENLAIISTNASDFIQNNLIYNYIFIFLIILLIIIFMILLIFYKQIKKIMKIHNYMFIMVSSTILKESPEIRLRFFNTHCIKNY